MSKFKIIVLLLVLNSTLVFSQNTITNVTNRNTTSLNGDWNYIVDPYETGYYSFHHDVLDQQKEFQKSGYFSNYHPQNKQELVEYDFDKSPKMTIPSDWNSKDEKLFYYEGTVWFKKSFDYNLNPNKRVFVYFGAVNYKAEVYLNGKKLGIHEGGFTPFYFEITNLIKEKDNFIVVKVDNTRKKDAVPTMNTDWWNYGGITRDVVLFEEENSFVADYSIQLKKEDKNTISGNIIIDNFNTTSNEITIKIPELKIDKKLKLDSNNKVDFEIKATKINYWSPENPKLYDISIQYNNQILKDKIGFRTIETKDGKILLNGNSVFLKGISIHEENQSGRANSIEDDERLLNWAKELGCNYIRLAHYPHNENMVRLAEKMGLMIWEEIPVYWTIDFTNEATYKNAENQLIEMISRDKNRCATIIWSVANETPTSNARNIFLNNLISKAKSIDDTRLISAALLTRSEGLNSYIDDEIAQNLDIVAFNEYLGWYGGNLEDAEKIKWFSKYDKPVIVSEFGGDAKQGFDGEKNERWTEEFQEYLYVQNLKMIKKIPNISGISPWILVDFRSPRRNLPEIQDGYNRKGLISNEGKKKKAFYILRDFYSKK